MITASVTDSAFIKVLGAFQPKRLNQAHKRAGVKLVKLFKEATPRGHTGRTRRAWKVQIGDDTVSVQNASQAMKFLERGTKAHGPKNAKILYLPLSRRALARYEAGRFTTVGLIYGTDYAFARMVKGIKALRLVRRLLPQAIVLVRREVRHELISIFR